MFKSIQKFFTKIFYCFQSIVKIELVTKDFINDVVTFETIMIIIETRHTRNNKCFLDYNRVRKGSKHLIYYNRGKMCV